jgi:hypothetical protein
MRSFNRWIKSLAGDALSGSNNAIEFRTIDGLTAAMDVSSCIVPVESTIIFGDGGNIVIDVFLFLFVSILFMEISGRFVLPLLRFLSIIRYIYAGFLFSRIW